MIHNDEKEHEDYLDKHFNSFNNNNANPNIGSKIDIQPEISTLEFINVSLDILPAGNFYSKGTKIKIRSAKVEEVQAYSVVDDKNYLDMVEKMNEMLSSCVRYIYPDGSFGSYKNVKEADRLYLLFMIRELTFQKGNSLAKDVTCDGCKHEFKIEFRATANSTQPKTFVNYPMPETLQKFFDKNENVYRIVIDNKEYKLAPPTIGIQEIFFGDIKTKVSNKKIPNVAFLKIIPYLLYDRDTISNDGIKAKEKEFASMDMKTFQILNGFVDNMKFGIEKLKTTCNECKREVHSDMTFPKGASSIFVISDYFDDFIKK